MSGPKDKFSSGDAIPWIGVDCMAVLDGIRLTVVAALFYCSRGGFNGLSICGCMGSESKRSSARHSETIQISKERSKKGGTKLD